MSEANEFHSSNHIYIGSLDDIQTVLKLLLLNKWYLLYNKRYLLYNKRYLLWRKNCENVWLRSLTEVINRHNAIVMSWSHHDEIMWILVSWWYACFIVVQHATSRLINFTSLVWDANVTRQKGGPINGPPHTSRNNIP